MQQVERLRPDLSPAPAPAPSPPLRDVAVVDVGSNSVRLVQYRLEGRAIWTVFNEKVLAGLGRGVGAAGRLDPEGAALALAAITRFAAMLDGGPATTVFTAATAAIREASDGPAFVAEVRARTGLRLRILSGEEEARYAALGVLAGMPGAEGLVGDLGGSSLELTRLGGAQAHEGVSLALGPFALGAGAGPLDVDAVRRRIERRLARVQVDHRGETLHAVGGAWRNLALLHMRLSGYPLAIVHGYGLSAREAVEAARYVVRQPKALERMDGVSKKRSETLPYAALVLDALVERSEVQRVEFSAYGVREGLLYEAMSPGLRAQDPLLAGCDALARRHGVVQDLGPRLADWLRPLFSPATAAFPGDREQVLLAAAAALADVGARLHPDHRADLVADNVLRAPLAGLNHPERAFLAQAAFARYSAAETPPSAVLAERLLSGEQRRRARAVGAALRLAVELSGRNPALLARASIGLERRGVVLSVEPGWSGRLLTEQTRKRLATLAAVLGRDAVTREV